MNLLVYMFRFVYLLVFVFFRCVLCGGVVVELSALKHGFFSGGFMLCDRCVWNTRCDRFKPGERCFLEQDRFRKFVSELMEEFDLDCVVDRIMVERAAMYLIRVARAEAYEAAVGVTEKSAVWGAYISRLDNTLRHLLNDLAVTRLKRKQFEKNEAFLVSVDKLIKKFAEKHGKPGKRQTGKVAREKRRVALVEREALLSSWRREYPKLRSAVRRRMVDEETEKEDS